ncbi:MAG: UDP-N-acetylglucosamine 2-epimerase (non-hydrolyzing) [Burkholderiales bacterium]|nr:UDP-N-acetylglucosamine 2-epimerase (non-hydrolyzing) [Burkholderiales bacterium]
MAEALTGGVLCVVGARPNFMKIAPIMAALAEAAIPARLLHTGQHYDEAMNRRFFAELGIPEPDINLEVGSASHAVQTAEIMRRFEPVLDALTPAAVLVVGDVNSTIACALVAAKKGVGVIHVEAGLRSFDRSMPEEINRVLTDQISDLLYTTERQAEANLRREGIDSGRIHFVGNVMIDTLRHNLPRAVPAAHTLVRAGLVAEAAREGFAVLTLHRPSNVDEPAVLDGLLATVGEVAQRLPVVFPLHPRTLGRIEAFGLKSRLGLPGLYLLPPLGYLEMLGLLREARLVLTDSGGIQEETTALGVPCLTLRENTERPITIEEGTNTLVGRSREAILAAVDDILATGGKAGRIPEYWDGQAARRIARHLAGWLGVGVTRTVAA